MSSSHSPAYGGRFALGWVGGEVKQWRVKHARDEAVAALRGGRGGRGCADGRGRPRLACGGLFVLLKALFHAARDAGGGTRGPGDDA